MRGDQSYLVSSLRSQAGQGIVEYILVLIVAVMIILGGLAQLNRGFRDWANNYFGNYLACLLETGELPTIGGTPGDSGTCNQFFKEFTWKQGRPVMQYPQPAGSGSSGGQSSGGGAREDQSLGASGSGYYTPVNRFGSGSRSSGGGGRGADARRRRGSSESTGNTNAQDYGTDYGKTNRNLKTDVNERVDKGFAFEKEQGDKQQRRSVSSNAPRPSEESGKKRIIIHKKSLNKDAAAANDSGWTFGNFLRVLIIAAIIIALVVLIGGQVLQIGKSMD